MLESSGYELVPSVLHPREVDELAARLPAVQRGGVRSLLDEAAVRAIATDLRLRRLVGSGFFAVRAVLFDKVPGSNWALGWHQDLAIAARERRDVAGFGPWTVKDGVPHALAPVELLAEMVTLRVHVDDCGAECGPLRVKPGSHRAGRIDDAEVGRWTAEDVCVAGRGDVLVLKPLLLHASSSSASTTHRRVLQLELARSELPDGLQWKWRV